MKEDYTVENGCIVISHGAGRGGSLSERIPLFNEDVAGRFSKNRTYMDMREAGEKLQGRYSFEMRLVFGIAMVIFIGISIINVQGSMNTVGTGFSVEADIVISFIATMFVASLVMLAMTFNRYNEIPNDNITQLVSQSDVRAALRSYYEEFVVVAVEEFSNSKAGKKPEISGFKIESVGDKDSNISSRQIRLSGRCDSEVNTYNVVVLLNFSPAYYNLKVIRFSVE